MSNGFDEMIENLIERGAIKQLLDLPGCAFNRLLETIRQKRAQRPFIRYMSEDQGAGHE